MSQINLLQIPSAQKSATARWRET